MHETSERARARRVLVMSGHHIAITLWRYAIRLTESPAERRLPAGRFACILPAALGITGRLEASETAGWKPALRYSRHPATTAGITSSTRSISSSVVYREREKRTAPMATRSGLCMAFIVPLGSTLPEWQAAPAEVQMPSASRARTIESAAASWKAML